MSAPRDFLSCRKSALAVRRVGDILLALRGLSHLEWIMFDRITFESQIMGGRACIRGLRIPVSVVVGQIAHGATWEEVLAGYPDLERDDIQQSLEYAAWLTHEEVRTA
jgi:uncharacterized protein (DUF433 family)